jgi:hypothetical protein
MLLALFLTPESWLLNPGFAQQPQAQQGQPLSALNAKYVDGVGPGYWPTAGTGNTLNLSAGTALCGVPPAPVTYGGGTLTMTASVTNYVYLDTSSSCAPAVNTTGFTSTTIPIAVVAMTGSAIGSITDVRTWFSSLASAAVSEPSVVRADLQSGADFGAKVNACLSAIYAAGGGTCDARGLTGAQTLSSTLTVGDGTHSVALLLGAMTLTEASGAQLLYQSHAAIRGQGTTSTIIVGNPSLVAVQQAFNSNGVSDAHLDGFSVQGSGTIVSGIPALKMGGTNLGAPFASPPDISLPGYIGSLPAIGSYAGWFSGRLAQMAVYNKALTATQVASHYSVGASGSGYETTITGDGPIGYWPLKEASGTTATDLIGGRNGTYTGGVTLGSVSGIPGDTGTKAALFDGATGYVLLPSYTWLTGGDFTLEGWAYLNTWQSAETLIGFGTTAWTNQTLVTDVPSNSNFQLSGQGYPGGQGGLIATSGSLTQGAWTYFAVTRQNGNVLVYLNGTLLQPGTDVTSSTFENLATSGYDIGAQLDSQHGCICYNSIRNVSPSGASFGMKVTNSSGYAYGVNQNQVYGGRFSGPIGLYDSGSAKVTYSYLDFEGNNSSTGAIVWAGPTGYSGGSGYSVGNTVQPAGGSAVLTVTGVSGGAVTSLAVTTSGTGYSNAQSVSTTTLSGSGSGLKVDIRVSAYMLLLSNGGSLINNPYEEAGGGDYICGTGTFVTGAFSASNGASYSPTYCAGSTGVYGGPASNFVWGPGATPNSIGLSSYYGTSPYIAFNSPVMYDSMQSNAFTGSNNAVDLYGDGPVYTGLEASNSGMLGHSPWNVGLSMPHGGIAATGAVSFSQLANPSPPTLTAYGGTGTTSSSYGLVCGDANGGHTLVSTPTATVSGPSALGALLTLSIVSGGSGYVQGDVGAHFTIGGDGAQGTITQVNGGSGTGPVTGVSLYVAGTGYNTIPAPVTGPLAPWSTSGGTGSGLTVTGTSTYISVALPSEDGCLSWTVLKGDTAHALPDVWHGSGSTNVATNLIDFGATTKSVTWTTTRNTTGDQTVAGNQSVNGTISSTNTAALNAATASQLAATPTQCPGMQFATGVAANGNANCATPSSGTFTNVPMGAGDAPTQDGYVAVDTNTHTWNFGVNGNSYNPCFALDFSCIQLVENWMESGQGSGFYGGAFGFQGTQIGGNTSTPAIGSGPFPDPLWMGFTSGATSGNGYGFRPAAWYFASMHSNLYWELKVRFAQPQAATDATNGEIFRIGWAGGSASGTYSGGVGLELVTSLGDTTWMFYTDDGSAHRTAVSTGVSLDNNFHTLTLWNAGVSNEFWFQLDSGSTVCMTAAASGGCSGAGAAVNSAYIDNGGWDWPCFEHVAQSNNAVKFNIGRVVLAMRGLSSP